MEYAERRPDHARGGAKYVRSRAFYAQEKTSRVPQSKDGVRDVGGWVGAGEIGDY